MQFVEVVDASKARGQQTQENSERVNDMKAGFANTMVRVSELAVPDVRSALSTACTTQIACCILLMIPPSVGYTIPCSSVITTRNDSSHGDAPDATIRRVQDDIDLTAIDCRSQPRIIRSQMMCSCTKLRVDVTLQFAEDGENGRTH